MQILIVIIYFVLALIFWYIITAIVIYKKRYIVTDRALIESSEFSFLPEKSVEWRNFQCIDKIKGSILTRLSKTKSYLVSDYSNLTTSAIILEGISQTDQNFKALKSIHITGKSLTKPSTSYDQPSEYTIVIRRLKVIAIGTLVVILLFVLSMYFHKNLLAGTRFSSITDTILNPTAVQSSTSWINETDIMAELKQRNINEIDLMTKKQSECTQISLQDTKVTEITNDGFRIKLLSICKNLSDYFFKVSVANVSTEPKAVLDTIGIINKKTEAMIGISSETDSFIEEFNTQLSALYDQNIQGTYTTGETKIATLYRNIDAPVKQLDIAIFSLLSTEKTIPVFE